MAVQSDFKALGGSSRQFKNIKTGETISRRQYDKLRGISYEKKAAFSKARNPEEFYLRPAKGRTSQVKAQGEIRKLIAETRQEQFNARRQAEQDARNQKRLKRKTERKANKRIHQKVIRPQLLKPGHMGASISVDSYEGYLKALGEMRAMKVTVGGKRQSGVTAYSVGVVGYDDRVGESKMLGATLWTMRDPDAKPISETEWFKVTEDFIRERSYFIFLHWFIHVAFNVHYAREKAKLKQ
jgi:hypothetical protein